MNLIEEPLLTSITTRADFSLAADATYLYGTGVEDRSVIESDWRDAMTAQGATFVEVEEAGDAMRLSGSGGVLGEFTGRQGREVLRHLDATKPVYVDMTGMSYVAWAPLINALVAAGAQLRVVYAEPIDYRRSKTPTRGMLFDLSEGFEGLRPIPGFAALTRQPGSSWHLVAALGFEGTRFAHVVNELEPEVEHIVPVVGVPGFRPEFATQAFMANRANLDDATVAMRVRYARANCPFDFFHTVLAIQSELGGASLRLAPIGTKPHGLGAVLYAMSRPDRVQLIYDHPRRKAKRTLGTSRLCVYDVSVFCQSDVYTGGTS